MRAPLFLGRAGRVGCAVRLPALGPARIGEVGVGWAAVALSACPEALASVCALRLTAALTSQANSHSAVPATVPLAAALVVAFPAPLPAAWPRAVSLRAGTVSVEAVDLHGDRGAEERADRTRLGLRLPPTLAGMTPGRGAAPVASSRFAACASAVHAWLSAAALGGHYEVAGG